MSLKIILAYCLEKVSRLQQKKKMGLEVMPGKPCELRKWSERTGRDKDNQNFQDRVLKRRDTHRERTLEIWRGPP